MSKTVLCDNLKAGLDRFRPFPPETLASLRNYYRVRIVKKTYAILSYLAHTCALHYFTIYF